MRDIEKCSVYRHYKGNLYYVMGLAEHTETCEMMVIYHALYGECETFVRPLDMFLEEAPKGTINPIGQKYRFEFLNEQLNEYK